MSAAWFVTGTDTEVGKTFACCALLHAFRRAGRVAVGMKPVAAGIGAQGSNDDVILLGAASSFGAPENLVNPYLFDAPIAPHVAAADAGITIEVPTIVGALSSLRAMADVVVIEGVGGFRVPLGPDLDAADLAVALGQPLILVVGLKLGCLNHALLTVEAIAARGLRLSGWIANRIDPHMLRPEASIDALESRIAAPLLGILPHGVDPEEASRALRLPAA